MSRFDTNQKKKKTSNNKALITLELFTKRSISFPQEYVKYMNILNIWSVKKISSKDSKNLLTIFAFAEFHVEFLVKVIHIIKKKRERSRF